jgi:hypothetical protein
MRWFRRKPRPEQLIAEIKAGFAGRWVAVHDGRVYAAAATSAEAMTRAMRVSRSGTVVYVPFPDEIPRWAARFNRDAWIGPNDDFERREQAERWARSCYHSRGPAVLMQRVDDPMRLGGVWVEVGPIEVEVTKP